MRRTYHACVIESQGELSAKVSEYLRVSTNPLIVIVGPTASGKTGLSVDLAHAIRAPSSFGSAEIINADSRQAYRGLSIGTAKISEADMRGIPHHLFDVLDPCEEFTVSRFRDLALEAMRSIRSRGGVPILVGGSMLYVSAIIDGLILAPAKDDAIRRRLEAEYDRDRGVALHARLASIDPLAAREAHPHNKPRVVRALEIYELTGRTKSAAVPPTQLRSGSLAIDALILGTFVERETLKEVITRRTAAMFAAGWIDEVRSLLAEGFGRDDPAMKSQGYREIIAYVQSGGTDEAALRDDISAKTRRFARRQMTWWKNDPRIVWIDMRRYVSSFT